MLKVRWVWEVSGFALLGAFAALVMSSSHRATSMILVLIGLLAVLFLPTGLIQGTRNAFAVVRSFTWWQGLWLLLFVSGLVFRERDLQSIEAEPLDAWAFFRIVLVTVTGLILLLKLALRQTHWLQYLFRGLVGFLASYSLVCMASSLWSVYPLWTFYKSGEYLVDVALLAAIVATAGSADAYSRLFDWTWTLLGLLMASVWLGLLLRPQEALVPAEGILGVQLSGIIPDVHPNTVGELGAVVGVIAFSRLLLSSRERSKRLWYGFLLTTGLLTMCLAQARSAIVGFVVGIILILLFSGRTAVGVFLAFASTVLLSIASVRGGFSDFMRRGEAESELYNLSSRVEWWSFAWPKILEHPFIGYGAYAGARFFVMAEYRLDVPGIHSDWLETLVGTGLWGFIPALLALLGTWWQLIKSVRDSSLAPLERRLAIEAIGALGVVSIRSIFTSDLFWHPPIVFLAALGYAQFLRTRQKHGGAVNP
jgi:hypothetical protein